MTFQRNPKVEEAPLHGELMLFDPASSKFFVLNRTMAVVWRHCESGDMRRIIEAVENEFAEVDRKRAEADVAAALDNLVGLGLVTKYVNASV